MSYYFMAVMTQHDADVYRQYQQQTAAIVARCNGRPLSVNAEFTIVAGDTQPNVIVLLEFPSEADFGSWWNSDEYAVVKKLRERSADTVLGVGFEGEVKIPGIG